MEADQNEKKRARTPRNSKFMAEAQEAVEEVIAEEQAASQEAEVDLYRPDVRPDMRQEDSRTRAARRTAELRDHRGSMDDGVDKFYVDPRDIPDGWDYEWKRKTLLGKEDPAYAVKLARDGWESVPTSRHPHMMPDGGRYPTIEQDGMILMERPKEITEESRARALRDARAQVSNKERQLNEAPGSGQFGRQKSDGSSLVKVGRSYESIPIPKG